MHHDFEVSYLHLSDGQPGLAVYLADAPKQMLRMFDEVARAELRKLSGGHGDVFVRISDLPLHDAIHELRRTYCDVLVKTSGVVTHRSGVFRQLQHAAFDCSSCGAAAGEPSWQDVPSSGFGKPASCARCHSTGPFAVSEARSRESRYQKVTLQERPGSLAAGRMPRCLDVVLTNSLIDAVRLGDHVEVTGIYTQRFDASLNAAAGVPDFQVALLANHVRRCAAT